MNRKAISRELLRLGDESPLPATLAALEIFALVGEVNIPPALIIRDEPAVILRDTPALELADAVAEGDLDRLPVFNDILLLRGANIGKPLGDLLLKKRGNVSQQPMTSSVEQGAYIEDVLDILNGAEDDANNSREDVLAALEDHQYVLLGLEALLYMLIGHSVRCEGENSRHPRPC